MTGTEALDFIINSICDFQRQMSGAMPKRMIINWELAWDLVKLRRDEIGQLAEETIKHGPKALETHGLFGVALRIDYTKEDYEVAFTG